ncbi:MAG: hypothetical protein ACHQQR_05245, partial [Gemmatimonadales bacterium]
MLMFDGWNPIGEPAPSADASEAAPLVVPLQLAMAAVTSTVARESEAEWVIVTPYWTSVVVGNLRALAKRARQPFDLSVNIHAFQRWTIPATRALAPPRRR